MDHGGNPQRQEVEQDWLLHGKDSVGPWQDAPVRRRLAIEGVAAGRDCISLAETPGWLPYILSVCRHH